MGRRSAKFLELLPSPLLLSVLQDSGSPANFTSGSIQLPVTPTDHILCHERSMLYHVVAPFGDEFQVAWGVEVGFCVVLGGPEKSSNSPTLFFVAM